MIYSFMKYLDEKIVDSKNLRSGPITLGANKY